MSASTSTRVALIAGALLVLALLVIAWPSGSAKYRIAVAMPSAQGLRKNSDVRVGGVNVGRVTGFSVTPNDQVRAQLELDKDKVTVGRDASASVLAVNLLGENYLALDPGDAAHPLPADVPIPASRVTASVTLDQVLDVLDADTRTRLRVLINELGTAVVGRGADLNALLARFPGGIQQATQLLDTVVADNRTLGEVAERTDRFISRLNDRRGDLGALIDSADGAATSFAQRTGALERTLRSAPASLREIQRFLARLQATTKPLQPALALLGRTAPALDQTLAALPRFRKDAQPLLDRAVDTAPALTKLGRDATPVIRAAVPTATALASFSRRFRPLSKTLEIAGPGIMGTLIGWGRATSGRDQLSHVFHGQVGVGADALKTILDIAKPPTPARTATEPGKKKNGGGAGRVPDPAGPAAHAPPEAKDDPGPAIQKTVTALPGKVIQAVKDALGALGGKASPSPGPSTTAGLLDFLLKP